MGGHAEWLPRSRPLGPLALSFHPKNEKPGLDRSRPGSVGSARPSWRSQALREIAAAISLIDNQLFTMALRLFKGSTRTFLLAGFALNVIFSPVKGLMPSRALVAGFFTTFNFISPGLVNKPLPRRLFLITPLSESNTEATCLRDRAVSLELCVRASDVVGAPP